MSTKNLARTVIEGGRAGGNRWERRNSNARQRVAERQALRQVRDGGDAECFLAPMRQKMWRAFRDKLSPSERWLEQQVGRPWDLVRSELMALFDARTTAGRHILFCHMLRSVRGYGAVEMCGEDFAVDRHGLLRRLPRRPRYSFHHREPLPRPEAELARWLDGRAVRARGDILFWFTRTPSGAARQHHRLNEDDAALWRSLPDWFREKINQPIEV